MTEKLDVLSLGGPAIALGDIACDGDGCPPQLVGQTESFIGGARGSKFVDRQRQLNGSLPNYKIFE